MLGLRFSGMRIRGKILIIVGLSVAISTAVVGGFSIYQNIMRFGVEVESYRQEQMGQFQESLKDLVNSAYTIMEKSHEQSATPEAIEKIYAGSLKSLVDIPYKVMETNFEALSGGEAGGDVRPSDDEVRDRAIQIIQSLRYGSSGYFWINDAHPRMVMHPILPKLDGQDLSSFTKDGQIVMAEGTQTPMFKKMVRACQASPDKDGFVSYFWPHPLDKERWVRKLSYVRLFEPWNWIVGTGVYVDQVEAEAQQKALDTIAVMRYGEKGYFWVNDTHPNMVMHPILPKLNGQDISQFTKDGQVVMAEGTQIPMFSEMVRVCQASPTKDGFVRYLWPDPKDTTRWIPKLSYVRLFEPWNWIIGTGVYIDRMDKAVVAKQAELRQTVKRDVIFIVAATLAIMALAFLFAWLMNRKYIERPIKRAVAFADAVSAGDLTGRLKMDFSRDEVTQLAGALDTMADSLEAKAGLAAAIAGGDLTPEVILASDKDKLGQALRTMVLGLNEIVNELNGMADQVAMGSTQVSDSSQALSQGATQQAASLEQISSSMTEVGAQTKANAENASQANQLAAGARDSAEEGNAQMQQMIEAMGDINDSSKEIAKIIKTIDGIAFQTNLLALNAAVEAARAGKHGKGFAVVAQEVRNLAARSAKAARETTELINDSVKKVEHGSTIANETASALSKIVEGVTKVADLVGEIAAASNEQAAGIGQINQGLSQIDTVTQQNTANAEETAAAAQELSSQAAQVRHLLSRFSLKDRVGAMPAANAPHRPKAGRLPRPSLPAGSWNG